VASSVNLKSGLIAVGALRPADANSQEPVALETIVVATGARPGGSGAKRELFTEETQTVLVFERGAVVRLSAAVADGQLIFLTNKSTGKEVVTQVVRKRSFRPTNCYVDLEFTEACPGFWGNEFPKAAATPSAAGASVAKKLAADEDSDAPAKTTPPPNAVEIERLKQEVSTLQNQLKSLMTSKPAATPAAFSPAVVVAGLQTGASSPAVVEAGLQPGVFPPSEINAAAEISADLAKKEEEQRLLELFAMEDKQEDASSPKILLPDPQKITGSHARKKDSNTLLNAACIVLFLGAGAFAAYRFGALDDVLKMAGLSKPAPSRPVATAAKPPAPKPVAPATTPAVNPATPAGTASAGPANEVSANTEADPAVTAPLLEEKNPATVVDAANVTGWKYNSAAGKKSVEHPDSVTAHPSSGSNLHSRAASSASNTKRGIGHAPADSKIKTDAPALRATDTNAAATSMPVSATDANAAAPVDAEGVMAPKLINGRKSMAPPDMIRNYITGSVSVDAVVDTTGHVRSVKVLSGPEKLRATAIEQMKQYLYQPARKNGKPVPAHVQVSMQFWYEP